MWLSEKIPEGMESPRGRILLSLKKRMKVKWPDQHEHEWEEVR